MVVRMEVTKMLVVLRKIQTELMYVIPLFAFFLIVFALLMELKLLESILDRWK